MVSWCCFYFHSSLEGKRHPICGAKFVSINGSFKTRQCRKNGAPPILCAYSVSNKERGIARFGWWFGIILFSQTSTYSKAGKDSKKRWSWYHVSPFKAISTHLLYSCDLYYQFVHHMEPPYQKRIRDSPPSKVKGLFKDYVRPVSTPWGPHLLAKCRFPVSFAFQTSLYSRSSINWV